MAGNKVTEELIYLVNGQAQILCSPDPGPKAEERYNTLFKLVEIVRQDCSQYQNKDFGLTDTGRAQYTQMLHYMRIAGLLFGPQEG